MLVAFKDVLSRAEMFAHHHVARERLSVRQRMSDILSTLREAAFLDFTHLFRAEEGRMGVTITFIAILELMKEGLVEIVQASAYAPIHLRTAAGARQLTVVEGGAEDADAENVAALAQPAHPDENEEEADDAEGPDQGEDQGAPVIADSAAPHVDTPDDVTASATDAKVDDSVDDKADDTAGEMADNGEPGPAK